MGRWIFEALLVGFVSWVIWSIAQARYPLEIRIAGGQPTVRKGRATAAFLREVAVVCRESGVARGRIVGVPRGRWVGLQFSKHFPRGAQQRLRNAWELTA